MHEGLLLSLIGFPLLAAFLCLAVRTPRGVLRTISVLGAGWTVLAVGSSILVFSAGPIETAATWLRLDALSAWHLAVLGVVFGASSVYASGYFAKEILDGVLSLRDARRFGALWFGSATAMTVVLLSNNMGVMWVGIETTTLTTAFLISIHVSGLALEAMWKYLVVCSVGVAFAFMGTLLLGAGAQHAGLASADMLLWTRLRDVAPSLAPAQLKLAFLFMLVGYGTKAGVAPMHSWLPDAHSQAPAPVSALLSGFLLNAALYCVLRVVPLVEGATGNVGFARHLLVFFGLASMCVAAAFIVLQRDGKRLLAYSSVEHLGIIALGVGLGELGTFAALWHTLNHALAKTLAFFSMGRLGQQYGTHDLAQLSGAASRSPLWGLGFAGGLFVLIGSAPFAIFMSELTILRAAVAQQAYVPLALFLVAVGVVFVGALRHAIGPAWGAPVREPKAVSAPRTVDVLLVLCAFALLLTLGLWLPTSMQTMLRRAAQVIGGQP